MDILNETKYITLISPTPFAFFTAATGKFKMISGAHVVSPGQSWCQPSGTQSSPRKRLFWEENAKGMFLPRTCSHLACRQSAAPQLCPHCTCVVRGVPRAGWGCPGRARHLLPHLPLQPPSKWAESCSLPGLPNTLMTMTPLMGKRVSASDPG